jgi:opacity protein-like surface antigen
VKRAHAFCRAWLVTLGFILLISPFSLAQEKPPEEKVTQKKSSFKLSKLSFGAYGQVSLPVDPYLETQENIGPGFGLGSEYQLTSWTKVGVGFRYSFHKGVGEVGYSEEHRIDWRTTGESIYGKFFPGYEENLPIFGLIEISFYQFHPTHHISYLVLPFGDKEEKGKTRTRAGVGMGVGLEPKITDRISLNFQTLFMMFANKGLSFHFDSGYSTRLSNDTRLLILQGGILYSPF